MLVSSVQWGHDLVYRWRVYSIFPNDLLPRPCDLDDDISAKVSRSLLNQMNPVARRSTIRQLEHPTVYPAPEKRCIVASNSKQRWGYKKTLS